MEALKHVNVDLMEEDKWKNFFRNLNVDIFQIIKSAIMVAASDHPQEFETKRDMIIQTLLNINVTADQDIDDEGTIVSKVLKIKDIIEKNNDQYSEMVLCDLLSKLQHMVRSASILKLTGIRTSVSALESHVSKNVAKISRTLIKEWRCMVDDDECVKQTKTMHEEKQQIAPMNNRGMIVRIKLKKEPTDDSLKEASDHVPVTPEQKVESVSDIHEVLKIKGILERNRDDESLVLELLRKLERVTVCVETLEATGIGKSVRVFQKHGCKDVREIACVVVRKWKGLVEEYCKKESATSTREQKTELSSEKLKATKRKLKEAYEEEEKKKGRIQVIELHELTNKGFSMKPLMKRQKY